MEAGASPLRRNNGLRREGEEKREGNAATDGHEAIELTKEDCEEYEGLVDDVDGAEVVLNLLESFKSIMEESTVAYCSFVTETQKVGIVYFSSERKHCNFSKRTEIRRNRGRFC